MTRNESHLPTLPEHVAERVLARAAELDVEARGAVPLARLREAAAEAGIGPPAFDAALAEAAGPAAPHGGVPWWVRVCLVGVVDRRGAMVYYWFFAAMLVLGPTLVLAVPPRVGPGQRLTLVVLLSAWAMFSLWSTARAVRWADRHGWERLP